MTHLQEWLKLKKKKTLILNPDKNPHTNIYNSFFIIAKKTRNSQDVPY